MSSQESVNISSEFFEGYKNNLVSRLYGLLCEREHNGEWKKFAETLHIELMGFECDSIYYWRLRGNLGALSKLDYPEFRKTIFECMRLVKGMTEDDIH